MKIHGKIDHRHSSRKNAKNAAPKPAVFFILSLNPVYFFNINGAIMRIVILFFVLVSGIYYFTYYPGYVAFQEQKKREFSLPFIETIHTSLKTYSDKQPNNLFPEEINGYKTLRQLVISEGKSIPENQNETKIDYIDYETVDRKTYILRINIEDNEQYFFVLYPGGIIEAFSVNTIDDKNVKETIRTLLNMDRALLTKNTSEYVSFYSSDATISIKENIHEKPKTNKNIKKIKSESYEDLGSYASSFEKFYNTSLPTLRKRNRIYIEGNGPDWKVNSGYIEEGTIGGENYTKDGQTLYTFALNKSPIRVIGDKSFAFIYFQ
jgi:hypothetical protein